MPPRNRPRPSKAELLRDYMFTYALGMRNPPTFGPHRTPKSQPFEVIIDGVPEPDEYYKVYLNGYILRGSTGNQPIKYSFDKSEIDRLTNYLSFRKFIKPKGNWGRYSNAVNELSEIRSIAQDPNMDEILTKTPIYKYVGPTEPHTIVGHRRSPMLEINASDVPEFKLHFTTGPEMTNEEMGVVEREVYNLANRNNIPTKLVPNRKWNSVSDQPIRNGDIMVNFHGRYNQGIYMKRNTFRNRLPYYEKYKRNPNNTTRNVRRENITLYKARLPGIYNTPVNEGVKNVPHNATNAISFEDIEEGDEMIDFLGERNRFGHYFKKNTFNMLPIRSGETLKRHPLRQPWAGNAVTYIRPENVRVYRAHKLSPPATQTNTTSTHNQTNRNRNTRRNNNSRNNSSRNNSSRNRTNSNTNSNSNSNSNTNSVNSSPGVMGRLRGFFSGLF